MDILSIFTNLGSSFGIIRGLMNRVFDIKSGHDFCRYRNSIPVIYFQINANSSEPVSAFNKRPFCSDHFELCNLMRIGRKQHILSTTLRSC